MSDKDREVFALFIDKSFRKLFAYTLDLAQPFIPADKFSKFRSRILSMGNDQLRLVLQELCRYKVKLDPEITEVYLVSEADDGVQIEP